MLQTKWRKLLSQYVIRKKSKTKKENQPKNLEIQKLY